MFVQPAEPKASEPAARVRRIRVPSGVNLVGIFGVLISIFITAAFLAYHAMWIVASQCPPWLLGCPYVTGAQLAFATTMQGLAALFLVLLDLAMGLTIALAFLSATRSDIPEGTRRSLFLFATTFLFIWTLVGTFLLPTFLGGIRFYYY